MTSTAQDSLPHLTALRDSESTIRAFVEEHMVDECGLVLSPLNAATLRPWTGAELKSGGYAFPAFCHPHCEDPDAYLAYEDSLMATGEYAHSQILRYQVTGDPFLVSQIGSAHV